MIPYVVLLLHATAVLHAAVGVWVHREPLAAILRDGFLAAVDPHVDRRLAFWFILFAPILSAMALVMSRAAANGDTGTLALLGWTLLGLGVFGAAAMPVSGFWILLALSIPVLREAYLTAQS